MYLSLSLSQHLRLATAYLHLHEAPNLRSGCSARATSESSHLKLSAGAHDKLSLNSDERKELCGYARAVVFARVVLTVLAELSLPRAAYSGGGGWRRQRRTRPLRAHSFDKTRTGGQAGGGAGRDGD